MRLLLIGPFGEGTLPQSYAEAFEALGHDVARFDCEREYLSAAWYAHNRWARRLLRPALWRRVNARTLEAVRGARPEAVLVFKGTYMHSDTVRTLQEDEAVRVCNYYPDNPYCGMPLDPRKPSVQRRDLVSVLRCYGRVYTWDRRLVERLRRDGVSAAYVPFGVDARVYRPVKARACDECGNGAHEVVFVGQHDAKRQRTVDSVRRHCVALFGNRWRRAAARFGGRHAIHLRPAYGTRCAALYGAAQVSLNILNDLNMPGHNMRTFEIPASGGVMVATHTEEQAAFFPEGEAAWYYRQPEELDDLIEKLRRDRAVRERTREAALRIAREHDYVRRAGDILRDLGAA